MAAFLYCIGAAKAGTTWLARALRQHDQAVLPPIKETHYFDSLQNDTATWAVDQIIRVRGEMRAEMSTQTDAKLRKRAQRSVQEIDRWLGLIGSQRRNDALYQNLMRRPVGPEHKVVADVTPAYALLKPAVFKRMAALNDGDTRFLMILRDPIDRLWSNISMTVARREALGVNASTVRASLMDEVLTGEDNPERARSDYAGTLSRLEQAVPAPQRMVLFFEDLFRAETLARLSDFLGLDTPLSGPEERVNAGTGAQITTQERAQLATLLRPQYEDVKARLGAIPQRWHDNLAQSMVTT